VGNFDHQVSNEAYLVFAEIIQKCWRVEYELMEAMLYDAICGHDEYLKVHESSAMMQNSDRGLIKGTNSAVIDCTC
jgi:hypothetical protein